VIFQFLEIIESFGKGIIMSCRKPIIPIKEPGVYRPPYKKSVWDELEDRLGDVLLLSIALPFIWFHRLFSKKEGDNNDHQEKNQSQ
jgi:hypothetical protein